MRLGLFGLAFVSILAPSAVTAAENIDRSSDAASHLQRARALAAAGDHTRAIAEQTSAIALAPTAEAFKARAQSWALKRQCELAVADFGRAIELAPRDADTYFRRAECLRIIGHTSAAEEDLTKVLRFDRSSAAALRLRAHVRLADGRVSDALTDLRWAADYDPRDISLLQLLGFARFANGDYEIAAENLARSLRFRDDLRAMLLLYIARGKSGIDGREELRKHVGYLRHRAWPFPAAALYLGHGTPEGVIEKAQDEAERCQAYFYVGYWLQLQGRRADGYGLLKKAANTCPKTLVEYETLTPELRRRRSWF